MFFDDHDVSGKRLFWMGRKSKNRKAIISREKSMRVRLKVGGQRTAVIVAAPMLLIALCVLAWFGFARLGRVLYSENSRYLITNIEIRGCRTLSPERIKAITGVKEGINLFGFSIRKVRRDFLEGQHNVRSFQISRHLPGLVRISIEERIPVALIGFKGDKVVDNEGHIFPLKPGMPDLPYISGYRGPKLQPGGVMQSSMLSAAVQVLELCEDPRVGLRADSVDIGQKDRIDLQVYFEGDMKTVRLAWKDMEKQTQESKRDLMDKLGRLVRTIQSEEARKYPVYDCTLEDNIRLLQK